MNLKFINKIAPDHSRTSCSDTDLYNCTIDENDMGGCRRCDLLEAARDVDEDEDEEPC